jgi:hypothetical protein
MVAGDVFKDDDRILVTDQTGSVEGIARGFGTHLPQDLGAGGFHIEEVPDAALRLPRPVIHAGEELDDYDDPVDGVVDDELAIASQPGMNDIDPARPEPTPGRIPIQPRHPRTFDDTLDASREIH